MAILEAANLFSGYGETEILHGVSMKLDPGEFVAIIGPNGAGKSTLIKTMIGLLKPTKGTISFEGDDITGRAPEDLVLQGLAYVPQTNNTFPSLTVRENLEIGAITRRPGMVVNLSPTWFFFLGLPLLWDRVLFPTIRRRRFTVKPRRARVARLTDVQFQDRLEHISSLFPNLKPKLGAKVHTLSGGEQQMVALAKTLILDPRVLLVDEPSAGLAPKLVSLIFDKILEINDHGVAIVLVEQNAKKALAMADRGYVLEGGKNRYEGPGQALLHDPDVGRLYLGG